MPGPRYTDWTGIDHGGDPEGAAPYISEARKLLGWVMEDAAFNKLERHYLQRVLPDGTVITAEKMGEIPKITIRPAPRPGQEIPKRPPDDFVVWARDDAHIGGIDPDHPQQILKSPGDDWKTYFFSSSTPGHDDFGRPKGTYIGAFPEGLRHAGNVDWVGSDKSRLSWYGPSTRYWYDPYVQMVAQYDRKVFMLGQVVLDTDQYIEDSAEEPDPEPAFDERYVLGAALRGASLYVVQIQAQNLTVPTPDPAEHNPPNAVYIMMGPAWTPFPVAVVLARYSVVPREDGPGIQVVSKSREVLWSGEIERCVNPWFFDTEVTRAVMYTPPDFPLYGFAHNTATEQETIVHELSIEYDDLGNPTATYGTATVSAEPSGAAPIADDYDEDGNLHQIEVVRHSVPLGPGLTNWLSEQAAIRVGGTEIMLRTLDRLGPDPVFGTRYLEVRRRLMWADARAGAAVLRRTETTFRDPAGSNPPFVSNQVWLEIWVNGVRILDRTDGDTVVSDTNESFGVLALYSSNPGDDQSEHATIPIAPMLPIVGWNVGSLAGGTMTIVQGAHAGFMYLRYQQEHYFSYILTGRISSGGIDIPQHQVEVADYTNAPPDTERPDFDGMDSILGCAARPGAVVLSAYPKKNGVAPADAAALSDPSSTLPVLTGIAGANARFHPVWLLGRQPIIAA